MELKKSKKASLENKRGLFFRISFVIILSAVLLAFEWKSPYGDVITLTGGNGGDGGEVLPPITRVKVKPPAPKPKLIELLNIIEDDKILEEEAIFESTESGEELEVPTEEIGFEPIIDDVVIDYVLIQHKPEFPGGMNALMSFINSNIKYPEIAKDMGIDGTVAVEFIIDTKGNVTDVSIYQSVNKYLDNEAIRVANLFPRWKPGKQSGKAVNVKFVLPIKYRLQ